MSNHVISASSEDIRPFLLLVKVRTTNDNTYKHTYPFQSIIW